MKVKIKSFNGELPSNLKIGVVYDASRVDEHRMRVTCDDGEVITTNIKKSGYLGDFGKSGSWEIVGEN